MNYEMEKWQRRNWCKGTRHYSCEVKQDLFGHWLVIRRWGWVGAKRGQCLEMPCESYEESLQLLAKVEKRRAQRGYLLW